MMPFANGSLLLFRMHGDALCGPGDRLAGHCLRPAFPALVGAVVDVAMVAGKITAAVHLQHELTQRYGRRAHAGPSRSDRGNCTRLRAELAYFSSAVRRRLTRNV